MNIVINMLPRSSKPVFEKKFGKILKGLTWPFPALLVVATALHKLAPVVPLLFPHKVPVTWLIFLPLFRFH